MTWLTEIAPVAGLLALVILLWNTFLRKWYREWHLRRPVTAAFVDPTTGKNTKEIVLSKNSTQIVDLKLNVRINFRQEKLKICFGGNKEIRPIVTKYVPRLTKRDIYQVYTDHDDKECFWIIGIIYRNPGPTRFGLGIKTKEPGKYPLKIYFMTDEGVTGQLGNKLTIAVE